MSRPASAAARPQSASSRQAWGDNGGVDNPGMRPDSRNSFGDNDMAPAPMDQELYDSSARVDQMPQPVVHVKEPETGCLHKFKRGIRCKCMLCCKVVMKQNTKLSVFLVILVWWGHRNMSVCLSICQLGAATNFDDLIKFGDRRQIRPSQMFIKLVWRHFHVSSNHVVARQ